MKPQMSQHEKKRAKKEAEKLVDSGIEMFEDTGDVEAAMHTFDQAIQMYPTLASAHYYRAKTIIESAAGNLSSTHEAISTLLKIIKDDTSGRGEVTGLAHKSLADLYTTFATALPAAQWPRALALDVSTTSKCGKADLRVVADDNDHYFDMLLAADSHFSSAVTILHGSKMLDEHCYDQASTRQLILVHKLSAMEAAHSTPWTAAEVETKLTLLVAAVTLLEFVIACSRSALQTRVSNNIDEYVLALQCEAFLAFWEFVSFWIKHARVALASTGTGDGPHHEDAGGAKHQAYASEASVLAALGSYPAVWGPMRVICRESNVTAETIFQLYQEDNSRLLGMSGDLLSFVFRWHPQLLEGEPVNPTTQESADLKMVQIFAKTRFMQGKRAFSQLIEAHDRHPEESLFAIRLQPYSHDGTEEMADESTEVTASDGDNSTNAIAEALTALADISDMLASMPLVASFPMKISWDELVASLNSGLMDTVTALAAVCSRDVALSALLETLQVYCAQGLLPVRDVTSSLRVASVLLEYSLAIWGHKQEFKAPISMTASASSEVEDPSFESDCWYNLGCCYWKLGDSGNCERALRRYFDLALSSSIGASKLTIEAGVGCTDRSVRSKLIEDILADEDLTGITTAAWFRTFCCV